jgi:hypothetical protein
MVKALLQLYRANTMPLAAREEFVGLMINGGAQEQAGF